MNIQSLWGISPFDQYSLNKQGIKTRADEAAFSLQSEDKSSKDKSDPAKIADRSPVARATVTNAATANTLWQTQSYAQSPDSEAVDVEVQEKSVAEQFLEHMNKSPEELMREEVLKSLGYTEEELAALDPKELAKVEAKIKELIETKIEQAVREKGIDIDAVHAVALETV